MQNNSELDLLFDLLIDTTQSIIVELDTNGTLVSVKAPKGRDPGNEVTGKTIHDLFEKATADVMFENIFSRIVKPGHLEVTDKLWQNLLSGPGRMHQINQNLRKDGTTIWCEWFNTVMYDENNNFLCVASLVNDITIRKQLEIEHKYLVSLIELSSDIIVITSLLRQEIVFMNKAGCGLLGWSEKENLSPCSYHKYHPRWVWDMLEKECLPAAERVGFWQGDSAVISAEEKEIPVNQLILSHKNSDDEVEFYSTMIRLKQ